MHTKSYSKHSWIVQESKQQMWQCHSEQESTATRIAAIEDDSELDSRHLALNQSFTCSCWTRYSLAWRWPTNYPRLWTQTQKADPSLASVWMSSKCIIFLSPTPPFHLLSQVELWHFQVLSLRLLWKRSICPLYFPWLYVCSYSSPTTV